MGWMRVPAGARKGKDAAATRSAGRHSPDRGAGLLDLQATAGNMAVASLLVANGGPSGSVAQRKTAGWRKGNTNTEGWNYKARDVDRIRRVPVEGLELGNQEDYLGNEKSKTKESAAGRAIVLIPAGLDAGQTVDVMLYFHGYTGRAADYAAGWREHSREHTVRDVDQDRIATQLQAAGTSQLIAILPQGVGQSSFGKMPFGPYIDEVLDRVVAADELKDSKGQAVTARPSVGRLVLGAHSGGGATVVRSLKPGGAGAAATEIALFEAFGWRSAGAVKTWVIGHLDRIRDTPADGRAAAIEATPRFRAYYSKNGSYKESHDWLRDQIDAWFDKRANDLGTDRPAVEARFKVEELAGTSHETVVRGAGDIAAAGPLADALRVLDDPMGASRLDKTGKATWTDPRRKSRSRKAPRAGVTPASRPGGGGGAFAGAPEVITVLTRMGLGTPALFMALPVLLAGGDPLDTAARVLVAAGVRDSVDLTDTLFSLVHRDLPGGRIPEGREDLTEEWRTLRRRYATPALQALKRTPATTPAAAPAAGGSSTASTGAAKPLTGVADAYTLTDAERAELPGLDAAAGTVAADLEVLNAVRRRDRTPEQRARITSLTAEKKRLGRVSAKEDIERTLAKKGETPATWYAKIVPTTFLNLSLKDGVHELMAAKLKAAEDDLLVTQGLNKDDLGLKPEQGTDGLRPPKLATGGTRVSAHCYGLAVDLNYKGNPYIGLNASSRTGETVKRATLLVNGAAVDVLKTPGDATPHDAFVLLKSASDAFKTYLGLRSRPDELAVKAKALSDAGKDARDAAAWQKQIDADYERLDGKGDFVGRDPDAGFIDFDERVIQALSDAGVHWLGTGKGKKDTMHFQLEGVVDR